MNEWIDPKQRPPTENDANEVGMILAVLEGDGLVKTWWWDIVKRHAQRFSGWMPLPPVPGEEKSNE